MDTFVKKQARSKNDNYDIGTDNSLEAKKLMTTAATTRRSCTNDLKTLFVLLPKENPTLVAILV